MVSLPSQNISPAYPRSTYGYARAPTHTHTHTHTHTNTYTHKITAMKNEIKSYALVKVE